MPIVFAAVADPVGAGFVNSLAQPGGNTTGFMAFEYSISGKWLELLKQIAPRVTRVAVLRDSSTTSGIGQFGVIQAMASLLVDCGFRQLSQGLVHRWKNHADANQKAKGFCRQASSRQLNVRRASARTSMPNTMPESPHIPDMRRGSGTACV
jgi:ABC transporter substrate binding protein